MKGISGTNLGTVRYVVVIYGRIRNKNVMMIVGKYLPTIGTYTFCSPVLHETCTRNCKLLVQEIVLIQDKKLKLPK